MGRWLASQSMSDPGLRLLSVQLLCTADTDVPQGVTWLPGGLSLPFRSRGKDESQPLVQPAISERTLVWKRACATTTRGEEDAHFTVESGEVQYSVPLMGDKYNGVINNTKDG